MTSDATSPYPTRLPSGARNHASRVRGCSLTSFRARHGLPPTHPCARPRDPRKSGRTQHLHQLGLPARTVGQPLAKQRRDSLHVQPLDLVTLDPAPPLAPRSPDPRREQREVTGRHQMNRRPHQGRLNHLPSLQRSPEVVTLKVAQPRPQPHIPGWCICSPPTCSSARVSGSEDRSSSSWRASNARLSSRGVRTRSFTVAPCVNVRQALDADAMRTRRPTAGTALHRRPS